MHSYATIKGGAIARQLSFKACVPEGFTLKDGEILSYRGSFELSSKDVRRRLAGTFGSHESLRVRVEKQDAVAVIGLLGDNRGGYVLDCWAQGSISGVEELRRHFEKLAGVKSVDLDDPEPADSFDHSEWKMWANFFVIFLPVYTIAMDVVSSGGVDWLLTGTYFGGSAVVFLVTRSERLCRWLNSVVDWLDKPAKAKPPRTWRERWTNITSSFFH